jgi:death-on-curing protein
MSEGELPSVEDIYAVHEDIVERWDLTHTGTRGVLPDRTLRSVLDDAATKDDPYVCAATLLRKIASAHVFEDGNKRTAWVVAKTYLLEQGLAVDPSGEQIAVVMKHYKRYTVDELSEWLRTGRIDRSRLR